MMPLSPEPKLSAAATPIVLPPDPPDPDVAVRQLVNGARGHRDALERELLGQAMHGGTGLDALRMLDPAEFHVPLNQNVARAVLDLAEQGRPVDGQSVAEEMRRRPLLDQVPTRHSQLPAFLDPTKQGGRRVDPRTFGLAGWQHAAIAIDTTAYGHAGEIRAYARQDRGVLAARRAAREYGGALELDRGRVVTDEVGLATRTLAEDLVAIPKALDIPPRQPSADLGLPRPPQLSAAGRAAIRR